MNEDDFIRRMGFNVDSEGRSRGISTRTIRDVDALYLDIGGGMCAIESKGKEDIGPCRLVNIRGTYDTLWIGVDKVLFTFKSGNWGQPFRCKVIDDRSYDGSGRHGFQLECEEQ